MPAAVREADICFTGHPPCSPKVPLDVPLLNWNVFCEGPLLTQELDLTVPHTIPCPCPPSMCCCPHIGIIHFGWPTVLCWFFPQAFLGSPCDFGKIITGAKKVFVGGVPVSGAQAAADGSRNALGQQAGGGAQMGFAPP